MGERERGRETWRGRKRAGERDIERERGGRVEEIEWGRESEGERHGEGAREQGRETWRGRDEERESERERERERRER